MRKSIIISGLMSLLSLSCVLMSGCSASQRSIDNVEIVKLQEQNLLKDNKAYIAQVSDKVGASFSVTISSNDFKTKANKDGVPLKTTANIATYKVYLLKNTTSTTVYPSGGDPTADIFSGPFTITKSGTTQTITFSGVPSLATGSAYYVGVQAYDSNSTPVNITKPNNGGTAYGGGSAGLGEAVSTGVGVTVDSALVVLPTTALSVNINLLDAVGAKIEAGVSSTAGSNATAASVTAALF